MAQSSETLDRYDIGNNARENLTDVIYNISPTEVPMQSNFGRGGSDQTYKEWQIDELEAATNNAVIDGDEFTGGAITKASRVGNYHQISRKDIVISRRANIVKKAGRKSEVAYQLAKKGKELRRDVEYAIGTRKAAVEGNANTAMQAAGVPAWIRTNLLTGATGTSPTLSGGTEGYPNAAGTTGTAVALSESNILTIVRRCFDEGGNPNMLQMNTQLKQSFSNYLFSNSASRVATQYQDQGKNPRGGVSVVGAVDVYVTDFSVLDIVPNRFIPSGDGSETDPTAANNSTRSAEVFILDTDYWEVSYLDGYKTETIAKVGDHERRMLLVDWTLCSMNEAASGIITGVNSASAVIA